MKETLLLAIKEAGAILQSQFSQTFKVEYKQGLNNLVTEVDKNSEAAILSIVKNQFPGHFILSEECGEIAQESDIKWIIDPIDGTVNYAHGIPLCCVSIGIEKNGEMILGAVYNPFMNELFFAEKTKGAFLNERPVHVSSVTRVENSCIVTGFPYTYLELPNGPIAVVERFIKRGIPIRRLGSAALDLCWVACGRFDAFYEHSLNPWDSAAGYLIVEEAGGRVTDMNNGKYSPYQPGIIASNNIIHEDLYLWVSGKKQFS